MIDVYAIGTTLKLNDLVGPQLLKLADGFAKLDVIVLQVNKRLKAMGAETAMIRNLATSARALDLNLKGVGDNALLASRGLDTMKRAIPTGKIGLEAELIGANSQAAILGRQLSAIRTMGHGAAPIIGGPGGPIGGGRGGRGGGAGGGFGGGGHLHGGNIHMGAGGMGIGGVGMGLGGDLLIPLAAGYAAYAAAKTGFDAARDYQDAAMRFKALGLGDQVDSEALAFSKGLHVFGVSQTELLSSMAESAGMFSSFDEVKRFTPKITALSKANAGIYGDKTGSLDDEGIKSLMKFIDRRGGTKDDASFQRNLDLAERLVTGSGGFLKFRDLANFSQMGGTAFRGLSDEGLMHMEGLMIEQGGSKAATAMMSVYQNLVAGRTPIKAMVRLEDLGLAHIVEQTHGSVGGKPIKMKVLTDIKDSPLLQSDPAKWMNDVLLPAMAAKGITSQADILKTVNDVLSNRNASGQASIMTTQQFQVVRDYNLAKGAKGATEVQDMYSKSAAGAEADFDSAWTDFKNAFGTSMLPQITKMLRVGTAMLHGLSAMMTPVPEELQTKIALSADQPLFGEQHDAGGGGYGAIGKWLGLGKDKPTPSAASALSNVPVPVTPVASSAIAAAADNFSSLKSFSADHMSLMASMQSNDFSAAMPANHGEAAMAANGTRENADVTAKREADIDKSFISSLAEMIAAKLNGAKVVLDGQAVGSFMLDHMGREASRPSTGPSSFDTRLSPLRPDYSY